MTRITAILAALSLSLLAACSNPSLNLDVGVNSSGVTGGVGVEGDRASVGVNTDGNVGASVDVIQGNNASISVGASTNGGVGVGISVGSGPVSVGFGRGGWGLRI